MIIRTVLTGLAASTLLLAGCAAHVSQPARSPSPTPTQTGGSSSGLAPLARSSSTGQPADVKVAIITVLDTTTVSWVDGRIVPAAMDDQAIERLPGAEHQHTAPLAQNVMFFGPTDSSGAVSVDGDGVGTARITQRDFKAHFINADNNAARITFDAQGRVVKLAARYHP